MHAPISLEGQKSGTFTGSSDVGEERGACYVVHVGRPEGQLPSQIKVHIAAVHKERLGRIRAHLFQDVCKRKDPLPPELLVQLGGSRR